MTIAVEVNPANPGQLFACCGLFEIADRLSPGAEAWFDGFTFKANCTDDLETLLDALARCPMTNTMTGTDRSMYDELSNMKSAARAKIPGADEKYKELAKLMRELPIVFGPRLNLTIDWFLDDYAGGSRYKTWAGQQSVLNIAQSMKDALRGDTWRNAGCLSFSVSDCGVPFNFDADLGGQGGAIDIGFSFDPLAGSALTRIPPTARPVLELLAFIGLQRFRPAPVNKENRYRYTAWHRPLPIPIAGAAACGALPIPGAPQFEFRLLYRTDYLKSFLPAVPIAGVFHE